MYWKLIFIVTLFSSLSSYAGKDGKPHIQVNYNTNNNAPVGNPVALPQLPGPPPPVRYDMEGSNASHAAFNQEMENKQAHIRASQKYINDIEFIREKIGLSTIYDPSAEEHKYVKLSIQDRINLAQQQKNFDKEVLDVGSIPDPADSELPFILRSQDDGFREDLSRTYKDLYKIKPKFGKYQKAKEFGLMAVQEADNSFVAGDYSEAKFYKEVAESLLDVAVGLDPVTGFGRSVYELFMGRNLITGAKLTAFERSMAFIGVVTAGSGTVAVKGAQGVLKLANRVSHIIPEMHAVEAAIQEGKKIAHAAEKIAGFDVNVIKAAKHHIETLKQIRNGYAQDVQKIKDIGIQMLATGSSKEEVARTLSQMRRDIGLKYKNMTPDELKNFLYQRNIKEYGDPLGPSFNELIIRAQKKGLSGDQIWEKIIDSSSKPNEVLNHFINSIE